jgi:hypothetical protein
MAKGYSAKADILTRTRDGQDLNAIWDAYQAALEDFNDARQPLIDLLSSSVSGIVDEAGAPGTERFELATEFGIPQSIRPIPSVAARAYPFDWYDLRQGYTWRFLTKASTRQLDMVMQQALEAENALVFEQVTKALFNNANRSATLDGIATPFTVVSLYNADGSYIPPYRGQTFAGSHNHYLGTGANTNQISFDPQDFLDLAGTIEHHGFTRSQGYNIIFLMNPADAASSVVRYVRNQIFESGTTGSPATNKVVSLYDFIPTTASNLSLLLPPGYTLTGGLAPQSFAGLEVVGTWGPYLFIQDYQIPAGYVVAAATAGQSSNLNIVGIREDEQPELQGLILKPGNNNAYPLIDSFFIRGLGAGVRQRGAAAIMKLDNTGGAYTVPASMAW